MNGEEREERPLLKARPPSSLLSFFLVLVLVLFCFFFFNISKAFLFFSFWPIFPSCLLRASKQRILEAEEAEFWEETWGARDMAAAQLRSGRWQLANRSRQLVGKELGQRRSFGAGAGHEGAAGESLSYAGLTLHKPPEWKIKYAEFWGAAMW